MNIPPLTEERRKAFVKQVMAGRGAKIAVRNIRRDAITHIHKLTGDKTDLGG